MTDDVQVLMAVNVANHRLFQQRQALLWPQASALDYTQQATVPVEPVEPVEPVDSLPAMMPNANCQSDPRELPLPR